MPQTKKEIVKVEDLHKRYGKEEVLRGISMEVDEGEVVILVGPSGTGKSTLLRCINQLTRPDSGKVWVNGIDLTNP
ncbi:MAG: amino acid ABC transporter ATP-binding protein, partial [Chloroflexi bacterium]|nr:amino acid ABC transporter ATP-binding protein [Chloroflexota bacterium]